MDTGAKNAQKIPHDSSVFLLSSSSLWAEHFYLFELLKDFILEIFKA
jgi:hypothetical protein